MKGQRSATLVVFMVAGAIVAAEPAVRRAANVAALVTYPAFYHGQQVIVRGELVGSGTSATLAGPDDKPLLHVVPKGQAAATGNIEARGQFWDVGRMSAEDPRLSAEELRDLVDEGRRPKPGELLVLVATKLEPASPPPAPGIRSIALEPARYAGQRVTVTGQFRGRNLYGDLPQSPGISKWDFVIRAADAALWIAGVRPKGKGFDLAIDARVDTSRWVEVSGIVKSGRGLVWIEGTEVALAKPVTDTGWDAPDLSPQAGPAPEVVFSAPTEGEADVALATSVRIQFSRDLDPASLEHQVRISYLGVESAERGEPQPPSIEFRTEYSPGNRVLEIRFTRPLERFRTIRIELLDGITATDGAMLKPWILTFGLGGG